MINLNKLHKELEAAGVSVIGASPETTTENTPIEIQADFLNSYFTSSCRIDFDHEPTQQEKNDVDAVLASHNPENTYKENRKSIGFPEEFDSGNDERGEQFDLITKGIEKFMTDNAGVVNNEYFIELIQRRKKVKDRFPKTE